MGPAATSLQTHGALCWIIFAALAFRYLVLRKNQTINCAKVCAIEKKKLTFLPLFRMRGSAQDSFPCIWDHTLIRKPDVETTFRDTFIRDCPTSRSFSGATWTCDRSSQWPQEASMRPPIIHPIRCNRRHLEVLLTWWICHQHVPSGSFEIPSLEVPVSLQHEIHWCLNDC